MIWTKQASIENYTETLSQVILRCKERTFLQPLTARVSHARP